MAGLSFPRRIGVRLHSDYIKRYHLTSMQAKWQAYEDENFTKSLGKDFYHEDLIARDGWAKYYFKGKFPTDIAYLKLQIVNPQTGMLIKSMYFQFRKTYQKSLDGRYYVTDPILDTKIIKDGILTELKPVVTKSQDGKTKTVYKKGVTKFPSVRIKDIEGYAHKENVEIPAIISTKTRYSEKPKQVYLITPPHLIFQVLTNAYICVIIMLINVIHSVYNMEETLNESYTK